MSFENDKNLDKNTDKKVRGNPSKLVPLSKRTKREQSEIAKKGGRASAEKRQAQKSIKDMANMLLGLTVVGDYKALLKSLGIPEAELNNRMGMIVGLYQKACSGDPSAVRLYLEIIGESPKQQIEISGNMGFDVGHFQETLKGLQEDYE